MSEPQRLVAFNIHLANPLQTLQSSQQFCPLTRPLHVCIDRVIHRDGPLLVFLSSKSDAKPGSGDGALTILNAGAVGEYDGPVMANPRTSIVSVFAADAHEAATIVTRLDEVGCGEVVQGIAEYIAASADLLRAIRTVVVGHGDVGLR